MTNEGPTNDLLKRMLAAIAEASSRNGVERLVESARMEAEEEVAELVKSAVKASLLRQVVRQLESDSPPLNQHENAPLPPTPTQPTQPPQRGADQIAASPQGPTACYVYAITRDLPDGWTSDTPPIDPSFQLQTVRHRDLQAVISEVPLDAFSQAALDERLAERQWLEEKVRAHDGVVKSLATTITAIPCRFCTIVRGPEDVRSLLAAHYQPILDTIAKLDGREEWGVKIHFDPAAIANDNEPAPAAEPSGRQYLQQRKQHDAKRSESQRRAREIAHHCDESLSEIADEANALPPRTGKGHSVELVNAAYLIPAHRIQDFHDMIDQLRNRHASDGLEFIVTGPWPPYNFARLDLSLEAAA